MRQDILDIDKASEKLQKALPKQNEKDYLKKMASERIESKLAIKKQPKKRYRKLSKPSIEKRIRNYKPRRKNVYKPKNIKGILRRAEVSKGINQNSDEESKEDDQDKHKDDLENQRFSKVRTSNANTEIKLTRGKEHAESDLRRSDYSDDQDSEQDKEVVPLQRRSDSNGEKAKFRENLDGDEAVPVLDMFIEDLIDALPQSKTIKDQLVVYDEHLGQFVHLYQLLCQGFICPGYINLLTTPPNPQLSSYNTSINKSDEENKQENKEEIKEEHLVKTEEPAFGRNNQEMVKNKEESRKLCEFIKACFGMVTGDFGQFVKYADVFVQEMGVKETEEYTGKEIALKIMLMVHDSTDYRN